MIRLSINGTIHELDLDSEMPLLRALRDTVGLTGTKYGCGAGLCGACTVLMGGRAVRACTTRLERVGDRPIVTIEGLSGPVGDAVKQAWEAQEVVQCGYCQSGQVMAAAGLLARKPKPTDAEIDSAMRRNICRCGTYARIRKAIRQASDSLE